MPSGTLIRKIIRQPVPSRSAATSQPARIGPQIAASPMTGPKARERAAHLLAQENLLDHAESLWDQHRAEGALQDAGDDQHVR